MGREGIRKEVSIGYGKVAKSKHGISWPILAMYQINISWRAWQESTATNWRSLARRYGWCTFSLFLQVHVFCFNERQKVQSMICFRYFELRIYFGIDLELGAGGVEDTCSRIQRSLKVFWSRFLLIETNNQISSAGVCIISRYICTASATLPSIRNTDSPGE